MWVYAQKQRGINGKNKLEGRGTVSPRATRYGKLWRYGEFQYYHSRLDGYY